MPESKFLYVRFEYIAVIFHPQTENPAFWPGLCLLIAQSKNFGINKNPVDAVVMRSSHLLTAVRTVFVDPALRVNKQSQLDFNCSKVAEWRGYHLSTALDGYARFIVAWRLCAIMSTQESPICWKMHCGLPGWIRSK